MSLIKQLIPSERKFSPADPSVNWTRIETLVHGPGAGDDHKGENSAVYACLNAIASAYPEPPLKVYQKDSQGKAKQLEDSPLQALLDKPTPNGELDMEEMLFWTAWAKHTDGNAYWLKVRSGDRDTGNVIQLWPISPALIEPVTVKDSGDWISYYNYQYEPAKYERVPVSNIIHFRLGLDDRDMRRGMSPLKALVRQISTDEQADAFVYALLKNYAIPGIVVTPGPGVLLTQADADDLTDKIRRKFGGDNRGNIAVLSKQSDVKQFGFSPADMDMTVLHRIPEERISAAIGVPAIVAGLGAGLDRSTYDNANSMGEWFTERKLIPLWRADARKLTNSLREDFTSDKRIYIEHDLSNVRALQEDEDAKYKRLQIAVGKPWSLRNEARTDTGLDPIEAWDEEDLAKPAEPVAPIVPQQPEPAQQVEEQTEEGKDLDRWKRKALKGLRSVGNANVEFTSDAIQAETAEGIRTKLASAKTDDEVRAVFAPVIEVDPLLMAAERLTLALEKLASV